MRRAVLAAATVGAAILAAGGPGTAYADTNLAQIGCSDGSTFNVSADTDTLTKMTLAVGSVNSQPLGFSCSLTQLPLSSSTTTNPSKAFAVGGGYTASNHFAFSAHQDPNTGAYSGYAVDNTMLINPNGFQVQGHVDCANFSSASFRIAYVQFTVEQAQGTLPAGVTLGSQFVMYVQDNGAPGTQLVPDQFQDGALGPCPSTYAPPPSGPVVQGNIVVRIFS